MNVYLFKETSENVELAKLLFFFFKQMLHVKNVALINLQQFNLCT